MSTWGKVAGAVGGVFLAGTIGSTVTTVAIFNTFANCGKDLITTTINMEHQDKPDEVIIKGIDCGTDFLKVSTIGGLATLLLMIGGGFGGAKLCGGRKDENAPKPGGMN